MGQFGFARRWTRAAGAMAALALGAAAMAAAPATAQQTRPANAADAPGREDDDRRLRQTLAEVMQLERQVAQAEAVSQIKTLMRTYSYYLDRGLWADLADLMTEDARGAYPAGVFVGKDSLAAHFLDNNGRGRIGLGHGRLGNHIALQPVITVHEGGDTAEGRWRVLAQLGQYGAMAAWAGGTYEVDYRREDGVWKISDLRYYGGFSAPYERGWSQAPAQADLPGAARLGELPHPADGPAEADCPPYPDGVCVPPFHYANPGSGEDWRGQEGVPVQPSPAEPPSGEFGELFAAPNDPEGAAALFRLETQAERVADLSARAQRLADERAVENLMRTYGYYVDRMMWDQAADLFADGGTWEAGQMGVYRGRESIRRALALQGPQGLPQGRLNDHLVLQPVVHVAPDGDSARGRFRSMEMTGQFGEWGRWGDGVYENAFVKEDGVWRIAALHLYTVMQTDIADGWADSALPAPGPSADAPADAPPSVAYAAYPEYFAPPFHYPNPVTGKIVQYREDDAVATAAGAPIAPAAAMPGPAPRTLDALERALAEADRTAARVQDANAIDNLIRAYGYYLDKGLYNELAELFAEDGSMELAQRGVYVGRERVREFLTQGLNRGRPDGPQPGFLQDHMQLQPVIHVAEDGRTAKARMRAIMMMGFAGRSASWGAGIYEDEFVKEDGRWKFQTAHVYNTFNSSYENGWIDGASPELPGQNPDVPPDAPPTLEFTYYPDVYDIPFHYDNPVSGAAPYSYGDGARD